MTRLFFEEKLHEGLVLSVAGDRARYLSAVLRCRQKDRIIVTDSGRTSYYASISSISAKEAVLLVEGSLDQDNESAIEITLMQGILKGEKMDLVIRKATELGVTAIMPVITERCQVRETRKQVRWQKIAEEASRQSGRNRVPVIHGPLSFEEAAGSVMKGKGIIFWEKEGDPLPAVLETFRGVREIALCIGPEGGFSDSEVQSARENGFRVASLGRRILRAETAAISVVAVVQYSLGDIGASL